MSLYKRKSTVISSTQPAKEKAQNLRAAADATNPARWLATLAASPTTSRNNQLLAADLQAKVEADPAIRDAVFVALVLATANAHAEADRVFLEPVTRERKAAKTLAGAQKAGGAKNAATADAEIQSDFIEFCTRRNAKLQGWTIEAAAATFLRSKIIKDKDGHDKLMSRRYIDRFKKLRDAKLLPKI